MCLAELRSHHICPTPLLVDHRRYLRYCCFQAVDCWVRGAAVGRLRVEVGSVQFAGHLIAVGQLEAAVVLLLVGAALQVVAGHQTEEMEETGAADQTMEAEGTEAVGRQPVEQEQ